MSVSANDYLGLQLSKARQQDLRKEAEHIHEVNEQLKLRTVKRRLRLPKITISWN